MTNLYGQVLRNLRFIRTISIYTVSNAFNSGINFFILPLITSYLTPSEYGIYSLFLTWFLVAFSLVGISSHGAIQIAYYKLNKEEFSEFISSALSLNLLIFLFSLFVILLFKVPLSQFLQLPSPWIWVIPIVGFCQIVHQVILVIFQSENKPGYYGLYNGVYGSLNLTTSLAIILFTKYNWQGLLLALMGSYGIMFFVGLYVLNKKMYLKAAIKKNYIREVLSFGLPLIPHALSSIIIEIGNRLFIVKLIDVAQMGIYSVGFQVAKVISLLEVSFVQAYTPSLFQRLKENTIESKIKIVKISYAFLGLLLLSVGLLIILSPSIYSLLIHPKYHGALIYTIILSFGYFFSGVYKMFVGFIFYYKKTHFLSLISIVTILLSLLFNYYFIIYFGTIGAAFATVTSMVLISTITIFVSNSIQKMPWFYFLK